MIKTILIFLAIIALPFYIIYRVGKRKDDRAEYMARVTYVRILLEANYKPVIGSLIEDELWNLNTFKSADFNTNYKLVTDYLEKYEKQ